MSLTAERLRDVLNYNPDTGVFTWLVSLSDNVKPGRETGSPCKAGYLQIRLDRKLYYAHRLAWLYVHGTLPRYIDHADGNKANNRLSNLRPCTMSQNLANTRRAVTNTSGFKGVSLERRTGRWVAYLKVRYKRHYLGSYLTPEEAHEAYKAAAEVYFGEFGRAA